MPTAPKHPGRPKGSGTLGGASFTVRLSPLLTALLDAYCQGTQAGLAPRRRADIVRVALEHYLSGPVEAPVTLVEDYTADHVPMEADRSATKAAQGQDRKRTTGRKRPAAAKGDGHGAAGV
jgi:hypothetical protein